MPSFSTALRHSHIINIYVVHPYHPSCLLGAERAVAQGGSLGTAPMDVRVKPNSVYLCVGGLLCSRS